MYSDLTSNLLYSIHAGGEAIIVVIDMLTRFLTLVERLTTLSARDAAIELLPGIAAMTNLHPLFVHFPIVLLPLFFVMDVLGAITKKDAWRAYASLLLYTGTAFALVTVVTGLLAAKSVPHGEAVHEIMETHEHLAILILLLSATLSVWRINMQNAVQESVHYVFLSFAGLVALLLIFTADLGGLMVYQHGVAVTPVMQSHEQMQAAGQHAHEPGHAHGE